MPMFLFRRNVHDIAHADNLLVGFRSDDTHASRDEQHLIPAMDVHFVPRIGTKLTTARLKLLLISGVSSVCRVTGPPVNKGLFAGSAGIASGFSTFIRTSSFQYLVLHVLVVPVVQAVPTVWNDWNFWNVGTQFMKGLGNEITTYF